jgi:hypothetical protein
MIAFFSKSVAQILSHSFSQGRPAANSVWQIFGADE